MNIPTIQFIIQYLRTKHNMYHTDTNNYNEYSMNNDIQYTMHDKMGNEIILYNKGNSDNIHKIKMNIIHRESDTYDIKYYPYIEELIFNYNLYSDILTIHYVRNDKLIGNVEYIFNQNTIIAYKDYRGNYWDEKMNMDMHFNYPWEYAKDIINDNIEFPSKDKCDESPSFYNTPKYDLRLSQNIKSALREEETYNRLKQSNIFF